MASKTTIVSPEGARTAGCSATCDSYYSGVKSPSYQGDVTLAYTNYQVIATGIGNWRPKLIKVAHSYTYSDGSTGGETITYRSSDYGDANPWNFPAVKEFSDWENPFEYIETDPGTTTRLRTVNDTITGVEVVFEEGTPTTTYTASASANPSGWGTVKVGSAAAGSTSTLSNITAGSTVTVVATPATGYHFVSWSDGGAQTHDVTVNSDINLTATFEADTPSTYTVTIKTNNFYGRVSFEENPFWRFEDTRSVAKNSVVGIKASVYQEGGFFKRWENLSGVILWDHAEAWPLIEQDETFIAVFGVIESAHARLSADTSKTCSFGEVQILQEGETSNIWFRDQDRKLDQNKRVVFRQRVTSSASGFFVKWMYRLKRASSWSESTSAELNLAFEAWEVLALFQRTPTHLLVNSSDRSTPVQLVYDPETNKLVADY